MLTRADNDMLVNQHSYGAPPQVVNARVWLLHFGAATPRDLTLNLSVTPEARGYGTISWVSDLRLAPKARRRLASPLADATDGYRSST